MTRSATSLGFSVGTHLQSFTNSKCQTPGQVIIKQRERVAWHSPGIHVVEHASGLDEERADAGGTDVRMAKDFQLQPQSLIKANL